MSLTHSVMIDDIIKIERCKSVIHIHVHVCKAVLATWTLHTSTPLSMVQTTNKNTAQQKRAFLILIAAIPSSL